MQTVEYKDIKKFKKDTFPFLCKNETANNLIIGVANQIEIGKYKKFKMFGVFNSKTNKCVLASLITFPHDMILSYTSEKEDVEKICKSLVEVIKDEIPSLTGIVGYAVVTEEFVKCWKLVKQKKVEAEQKMKQGIYELSGLSCLKKPKHEIKEKFTVERTEKDNKEVLQLMKDSLPELSGIGDPDEAIKNGIFYHMKVGGKVVTMCSLTRESPSGKCIGWVFTPKNCRGKGYASWNVYSVCKMVLEKGEKKIMYLFTDLSNKTSNSIYKKIGFERVCYSLWYKFKYPKKKK